MFNSTVRNRTVPGQQNEGQEILAERISIAERNAVVALKNNLLASEAIVTDYVVSLFRQLGLRVTQFRFNLKCSIVKAVLHCSTSAILSARRRNRWYSSVQPNTR